MMPAKLLTPLPAGLWDQSCFSCVHPEAAQFWPSTRKSGSHSHNRSLQECCSTVGTLSNKRSGPRSSSEPAAQEGRVVLKQDAGWITLHSWRGWSPKVRAAFNGVAVREETASEVAFIMLGLWINSACCTLGSQVLVIKNVNRRIRLGKEQFSSWTFITGWIGVLLPPLCFDFRQRALHPMLEFPLLSGRSIWM